MSFLKPYFTLTKPGVMFGNAITVAAGYLLAARGHIDWWLLVAVFVGSTLVIASACVTNNILDRDIDAKMERTKKRPSVSGQVSVNHSIILALILGLAGLAILLAFTNILVVGLGLIGFIDYVWFYGAWSKRKSVHGTLVGSISGAIPVLAGYVAVTNQIDLGAVLAFLAVFLWQQPEFYSIALYRRNEYAAAGVPVISVVKGAVSTKKQILVYLAAFALVCIALTNFGYTGYTFLAVMSAHNLYWLWLGMSNFTTLSDDKWGRTMFRQAMISILLLSIMMSVGSILP